MNIHLVAIDPQRSFCQAANKPMADAMLAANGGVSTPDIEFVMNGGELYVQGAAEDTVRLSNMVDRLITKIDKIHVTLDSHGVVDIAHANFWVGSDGRHPDPFTIITKEDVVQGVWNTTIPKYRQKAVDYVKALAVRGRNPLCIWPVHCEIGSLGASVAQPFASSLNKWCSTRMNQVDYVTKGSNPFTEHYSAVEADVPDPADPTTMLNTPFLKILAVADVILISGQALSHCVKWTITDIANNFGEENIKKFVLLEDTSSNVTGFEAFGNDFVKDMVARGMKKTLSTEYLA